LAWLGLLVVVPLAALVSKAAQLSGQQWLAIITDPRVVAAVRLSLGAAAVAALVDAALGLLLAWVLVRYRFVGRGLADAAVDLPFALPTAVAGIALTALYAPDGWLGHILQGYLGLKVAFAPPGIAIALAFVGLPFVVRTLQPVLQGLDRELEQAAVCLGATPAQVFWRVILPQLRPALVTGTTMAFARAVGEYGSVVFISGNLPGQTEIAPLLIVTKLEAYDYVGATAIACWLLVLATAVLLAVGWLQARQKTAWQAHG
jgi:sulfate transport system permease protein